MDEISYNKYVAALDQLLFNEDKYNEALSRYYKNIIYNPETPEEKLLSTYNEDQIVKDIKYISGVHQRAYAMYSDKFYLSPRISYQLQRFMRSESNWWLKLFIDFKHIRINITDGKNVYQWLSMPEDNKRYIITYVNKDDIDAVRKKENSVKFAIYNDPVYQELLNYFDPKTGRITSIQEFWALWHTGKPKALGFTLKCICGNWHVYHLQ